MRHRMGVWPATVYARPWRDNPLHAADPAAFHVVRLWARCRAGMGGLAVLPEGGGLNDQPAWLVGAFGILDGADAEQREAEADERRRRE